MGLAGEFLAVDGDRRGIRAADSRRGSRTSSLVRVGRRLSRETLRIRTLSATTPAPPPISLHHVGIVVADIARAREDYVRRFGYEVKSAVIHDIEQTAFVQFLRMPGDLTYIELVAPD